MIFKNIGILNDFQLTKIIDLAREFLNIDIEGLRQHLN